jgi:hypothetical protein
VSPARRFSRRSPTLDGAPGRCDGKGYRREWFEDVVGELLRLVSLRADTLTQVVAAVVARPAEPDRLALARTERERDSALARYRRDRDARALEATMARLDVEAADAGQMRENPGVSATRAVAWLADLGDAWDAMRDAPERRDLATAIFESLDVDGFRTLRPCLTPSAIAHGFGDVLPQRFVIPAAGIVENGRGERGSPSLTQQTSRFLMINATPRVTLLELQARSA